jgi:hypothetical protein
VIALFAINFVLLWLFFLATDSVSPLFANIRLSFVKTLITISILVFLFTEALSFFNKITSMGVALCWFGFFLVISSALLMRIKRVSDVIKKIKKPDFFIKKNYVLVILGALILIVVPLFLIATIYPPNNADSLCYHLPRIEHWIQNKNVDHYPTADLRHLYHQPLAEYVMMHVRILAGGDYFVNLVQFFSMIGSSFVVSLIIKLMGFGYRAQILSWVLTLSVSMGILQATSTQTDYVAAFFLISFIYFFLCLIIRRDKKVYSDVFWGGAALGLGCLTKLTVPLFGFPFCLWFLVALIKKYGISSIRIGLITVLMVFVINAPFYLRNYALSGDLLGDRAISKMMQNNKMNISCFVSNVIRNISLHIALPLGNSSLNKLVDNMHRTIIHQDPNDPDITFPGTIYEPFFGVHEDFSGNFFLIVLIVMMICYFIFYRKKDGSGHNNFFFQYGLALCVGFFVFCALFKWQPWLSRLQLPLFIACIPLITYFLCVVYADNDALFKKILSWFFVAFIAYWFLTFALKDRPVFLLLCLFLLLYGVIIKLTNVKNVYLGMLFLTIFVVSIPYVYGHHIRPLVGNNKLLLGSREYKYFRGNVNPAPYEQFQRLSNFIQEHHVRKVALREWSCFNEYLLWTMLQKRIENVEIRHAGVNQIFYNTKNFKKDFYYTAVVSTIKDTNNLYDQDNIILYKQLGSDKEPLDLIILKKPMALI